MNENRATNLDDVWVNFDPYTPLSADSAFYVERPGKPLLDLRRALLRSIRLSRPPKYYLSGHRGAGKSTEMNRLAMDEEICDHFVVIHYSIRDVADVNDLDQIDVLFTIGAQLFLQYTDKENGYGKKLPKELLDELDGMRGQITSRLRMTNKEISATGEAGLRAYFLNVLLKSKQEEVSRREIRQELEPSITDWLRQINLIAAAITKQEGKQPLVMIDDLDKPPFKTAQTIFHEYATLLEQPAFPIVYTVPIAIFFTREFVTISQGRQFLPSIKLFERNNIHKRWESGFHTMRQFALKRMDANLITMEALDEAAKLSGGVMRDMARLIQLAVDHALNDERDQINIQDIQRGAAEMRSDFRRMLSGEDIETLRTVRSSQEFANPEQLAPLLYISAAIEYVNDESWVDVHPVVLPLLE